MRIVRRIRYNIVPRKLLFWTGGLYLLSFAAVISSVLWVEGWLVNSFSFHLLMTASFFGLLIAAVKKSFIEWDSAEMHFPSTFSFDMMFRTQRHWDDISAVGVEDESNDYYFDSVTDELRKRTLFIYFKTGGHVNLKLSDLEFSKLWYFVDQIRANSQRGACTPELLELQNQLKILSDESVNSDEDKPDNFTKFWEDELAEHIGTTNFVPLEPGCELQRGKFLIDRSICCGGMSAVYLATNESSGKVVVKESTLPLRCNPDLRLKAREMFEREALLLYRLNHPKIAKVIDYFVENGRDYLVLEYIKGQSLRQSVRATGPVSESIAIQLAKQIAESIIYLHSQDPVVLHRDITPDNFVLEDDGRLTLIDFGAANEFISTATGTAVGKQCYVAPEQFKGRSTQQSDIYSIGCTLFYLVTGDDPEPLSQSNPGQATTGISESFSQLVMDCTANDLSKRLKSADELIQRLQFLGGQNLDSHRTDQASFSLRTRGKQLI